MSTTVPGHQVSESLGTVWVTSVISSTIPTQVAVVYTETPYPETATSTAVPSVIGSNLVTSDAPERYAN